jgi:hypothetical protein
MKEAIIISVLVIGLVFFAVSSMSATKNHFKQICDKSSGTTVWDGRQYQCIPATLQSK